MQIAETWSISFERIRSFFLSQDAVRENEDGSFSFGRCAVRIAALPPRRVGRFCFPQTRVAFDGPDEDAEEIRRRFVLQFVSAGG